MLVLTLKLCVLKKGKEGLECEEEQRVERLDAAMIRRKTEAR